MSRRREKSDRIKSGADAPKRFKNQTRKLNLNGKKPQTSRQKRLNVVATVAVVAAFPLFADQTPIFAAPTDAEFVTPTSWRNHWTDALYQQTRAILVDADGKTLATDVDTQKFGETLRQLFPNVAPEAKQRDAESTLKQPTFNQL